MIFPILCYVLHIAFSSQNRMYSSGNKMYSSTKIQLGMHQRYADMKILLHNTGGDIKFEEKLP